MIATPPGGWSFTVSLESEMATLRLMIDIANALEPGDVITLSGDLGAGKTTFARALIRYLSGNPSLSVPSPTFTILQNYDVPRFPVVHADLYRLNSPAELTELGFDDLPDNAVMLVEWPDRAGGSLPSERFDIAFTLAPQAGLEQRNARISGYGSFAARVERVAALRDFLNQNNYSLAERRRMQGDASTRMYERLSRGGKVAILMNSPRRPDGPPVRDGKPYSAIAHLAEDVRPFVAMAQGLRMRGFSAPALIASDLDNGFLIIEDLGTETMVAGDSPAPIEDRYAAAVDMLLALHGQDVPHVLPVTPDTGYDLPRYDLDAFLIEAELLLDWYLPRASGTVSDDIRRDFVRLWTEALQSPLLGEQSWALRDFHSPNLLWLPDRDGVARVGLLDFQDAMLGPTAYDLASLLQDARVDVPEALELSLLGRYAKGRREANPDFDAAGFARNYATLAAQRATKILGIFARLQQRDLKPQYLRHMPRIRRYLRRSLAHPALAELAGWYDANVPATQDM